jgi:hypothetical protein
VSGQFKSGIANGTGDAAGGIDLVNNEGTGLSKTDEPQKQKAKPKKKKRVDIRKIKGM